jgi:hypothetical protein
VRIAIITNGPYEFFFSLQGELLALGHDVYVLHIEESYLKSASWIEPEPLIGAECDLVFTSNFFESNTNQNVKKLLKLCQITCPVVSIVWSHPVWEIEKLWKWQDLRTTNAIIKDFKLIFWSPCQKATDEYTRLGFESIVFAPLGLSSRVATMPFMRWIKPENAERSVHLDKLVVATKVGNFDLRNTQIVYMGTLPKKEGQLDPKIDFLARNMAEESIADPLKSRSEMEEMWTSIFAKAPSEQPGTFLDLSNRFVYYHSRGTRKLFIERVKKEFADRFLLIGDDWIEEGVQAEPSQNLPLRGFMYHNVPISIDFGSLSLETCFFPRITEIVKNGGCPVGYRSYDSDQFYQEESKSLVFNSSDEMCEKLDFLLGNRHELSRSRENIHNIFSQTHGMKHSIEKVIAQAMKLA